MRWETIFVLKLQELRNNAKCSYSISTVECLQSTTHSAMQLVHAVQFRRFSLPIHSWAHQPTCQQQTYYTDVGTAYSPSPGAAYSPSPSLISPSSGGTSVYPAAPAPPSFGADSSNSRGTIVYPEFIDHLVHPDVDSFKDIPKLPGQTDPHGR